MRDENTLISFDEFIDKYDGRGVDFDRAFGDQCFDLYRAYVQEVLGFPQSPPTGSNGAKTIWLTYSKDHYDRIENTPEGVPQKGDIMIWGERLGNIYGHVAIVVSANRNDFMSFDQNFPIDSKPHLQGHNYSHVLGWLRPKKSATVNGMTDSATELQVEVESHKETLDKLQGCEADREELRAKERISVPKTEYVKMEREKNTEIERVTRERDEAMKVIRETFITLNKFLNK